MVELRGTLILLLATSLLAITASAYANPLAAYGDATERDVAVAIPGEGTVVPLSETAGIRFADGGVEAQWGRLYVRTYPTVTIPDGSSFERNATFTAAPDLAGNTVTYTDGESRMTYEVYESLLKETIVLNRPGNVSYRYEIGLTDWTTEEPVFDETGAEVGTTPHVEPASNSTWSIDPDRWGNIIISINGAETVVLPRPFATDADGVRYDLDYVLNTEAKTITIAGIPDSVRYPLTIDPTERVVNGGFETGDFSGWQTGGSGYSYSHSIRSSDAGRLPHSGSFFARVRVWINGDAQNGDSSSAHIQQTFDMSDVPSITFFGSGRAVPPTETVGSAATYIGSSQYGFPHRQYHSPDRWDLVTISPVPGGNNQLRFRVWDSTTFWSVSGSNYIYIDDVSALATIVADFTYSPSNGPAPLTVQFTDTSTGSPTSWAWDFDNDGTWDSYAQNPFYTYDKAGTYSVRLRATNGDGDDEEIKTGIIRVAECPDEYWTQTNSINLGSNLNASIASTIGLFNATYIPGRDVYEYNYRITSVGAARYSDGTPKPLYVAQFLFITETDNKEHQAIWTSTDPRYTGSWPRDNGDSAYYYEVAYKVTSLAIGALDSYAGFALSAGDLVVFMLSGCDLQENGETVSRVWYHMFPQSDVAYFFWWLVDVDPGETITFTVDDHLVGLNHELVSVSWTFTVTALAKSPDKMTEAEKEQYGVEVIPLNELKERSDELNIAPETVDELIRYGEPVYYAHKVPVEVTSHTPDKEKAIFMICEFLERAGYSRDELFAAESPVPVEEK